MQNVNTEKLAVDLKAGFATQVNIFDGTKVREYKLAILSKKSWFRDNERELFLVYIDEDTETYTTSFYSGGATGVGLDYKYNTKNLNDSEEDIKIETIDIDEIVKMIAKANEKSKSDREKRIKKQMTKVEAINNLPTGFKLDKLDNVIIIRTEANFNPTYSSKIRGGRCRLVQIEDGMSYTVEDLKIDGRYQHAKLAKYNIGIDGMSSKETIDYLLGQLQGVQNLVTNTK